MHGHKNLPWQREQYGQCHFLLNTRTRPGPGGSVREAKFVRRSNCQGNCTCGVRRNSCRLHHSAMLQPVVRMLLMLRAGWHTQSPQLWMLRLRVQVRETPRHGGESWQWVTRRPPSRPDRPGAKTNTGSDVSSYETIKSVSCSLRSSVHNLNNWGRFGFSTNSMIWKWIKVVPGFFS